ncbi:hypothetical protein CSA56_08950 [candidate division KSB3 bacterium]|uniref:DUF3782 domain-containing protein n=1 Tax=candidate division KSB3 bacterium TaxID=2044937 RepID=A0A2G6KEC4_9BACT|nr:MAG: hypothetical protein CSA56_08950 [candidate division KSB3 bacterium]
MITQEVRNVILHELPDIVKEDEEIHQLILHIASNKFADKAETESRFDQVLRELKEDREARKEEWAEHLKNEDKKWAEQEKHWAEQEKHWAEQEKRWMEQEKRWAEQGKLWKEQNRRWEKNQQTIERMFGELQKTNRRIDQSIGALGARWGLHSEEAFRNALKSILEESFGVEVIHVNEWDDSGMVFGRPEQVELDLIVQNGLLIICEIKSSVSKADVYSFERKVRYYEKTHQRTCTRMMLISPMMDERAKQVAGELSIEYHSHSSDVTL